MFLKNRNRLKEKINILCQGGDFVSTRLTIEAESLEKKGFHTLWFLEDKKERSRRDIYPVDIVKPRSFLALPFQILSLLIKRRIRLVATYIMGHPKRSLFTSLAAKLLGKPNVVMLFGSDAYFYGERGLKSRIFARLVLCLADFVIYHHPVLLRKLKEYKLFNPKNTAYIHHGVKLKPLDSFERKDKLVLYMNRFIWWKQPKLLIEAIPYVLEKIPQAKFIFLGVGDYPLVEMKAAMRVKELGIASSVRFVPYTRDVNPFLQQASIFVNTSKIPFLNNSLLEAMERGIPAISLQLPDVEPIIENGVNGFLCEEKPQALAEVIARLLSDEEFRQKLGRAARETVAKGYNIEDVADRYIEVFNQLLGKHNG